MLQGKEIGGTVGVAIPYNLYNLYRNVLQGKEIGSTIQSGVSPWVWGGGLSCIFES